MADILLLSGSPSAPSRSAAVLDLAGRILADQGLRTGLISVRDLPAEDLLLGRYDSPAVIDAASQVTLARAMVVATPVYKAAYSGTLKTFLDLLPQNALAGKIVFPLASGGSPNHLLALDYALKPVLSALGARHILGGLYVTDAQARWAEDGSLDLNEEIEGRLRSTLTELAELLTAEAHISRPAAR